MLSGLLATEANFTRNKGVTSMKIGWDKGQKLNLLYSLPFLSPLFPSLPLCLKFGHTRPSEVPVCPMERAEDPPVLLHSLFFYLTAPSDQFQFPPNILPGSESEPGAPSAPKATSGPSGTAMITVPLTR